MPKPLASHAASRIASAMVWAICAALPLAPSAMAAEIPPVVRFLNASPGADGTMTYAVSAGVDLLLPFTGPHGSVLEFYLSPFLGEHGDDLSVQPSIAELPGATVKDQRLSFPVDRAILTLRLQVPALPTAGKYTGTLVVVQEGTVKQANRVVLTRALAQRPAKVIVDTKSITVYQESGAVATFKLQARNASGEWPADGVFLRLLDVTVPAGANFDPVRHLKLTWNGQEVNDLWRSPSANSSGRSIPPNQQVEIGGTLVDLAAGEYTLKVGLGAANATVDSDQQITLKLFVKHGWWLPLLVLLAAIGMSYVATKGLEAQRKRVSELKKVAEMRPAWLRDEPAPMPAVAARAILKQVDDRNRTWMGAFFGQDVTSAHIDRAGLLIRILDRVRRIRSRIESAAWRPMVKYRAHKRLNSIADSLNPDSIDESTAKQVEADLGVLEQWFDVKQRDDLYWSALKADVDNLMEQARSETFNRYHDFVKALRDKIMAAVSQPPKDDTLRLVEETYAKLKVLWERNQDADDDALQTLVGLLEANPNTTIDGFFREADGIAWSRLETSEFEFVAPARNEVEPLQAYQLIRFEIAPKDRRLGNNYLFKHRVEYVWSLEFEKNENKKQLTQRRTNEPRLVQYVPGAGKLYVSVTLRYADKSSQKPAKLEGLQIQRSSEYGVLSAFRFNEVTALGIATVFALISGLATYYFAKNAFGSITDYISLFIWGAGVDQTKNFIQNLERTSGKS